MKAVFSFMPQPFIFPPPKKVPGIHMTGCIAWTQWRREQIPGPTRNQIWFPKHPANNYNLLSMNTSTYYIKVLRHCSQSQCMERIIQNSSQQPSHWTDWAILGQKKIKCLWKMYYYHLPYKLCAYTILQAWLFRLQSTVHLYVQK